MVVDTNRTGRLCFECHKFGVDSTGICYHYEQDKSDKMKSIINEVSEYLARSEETTMKKFIRIAGKNDKWSFTNAGYTITERKLKDGIDGIMLWRMTLMRYDQEVVHQDIEIKFNITME